MPNCLLCHSVALQHVDEIPVSSLTEAYRRTYAYSPDQEFGGVHMLHYYLCARCDLRFFWPPRTGSERFYQVLQQFPWYYLTDKFEYQLAAPYIRAADKVLEVGCGTGALAAHLATANYTGLEFSPEAADRANRNGLIVLKDTIEEHATSYPGSYDVVCAFQVLEHVADTNAFISASLRALKPGGLLIYSVPSAESYVSRVPNSILNMPPHHLTHWSDKTLRNLASLFSLELVSLQHEPLADIHKRNYASCVTVNALNKLLGRNQRMLDPSLIQRLLSKIAYRLAYLYSLGLDHVSLLPTGNSVTAVFRTSPGSSVGPSCQTTAN